MLTRRSVLHAQFRTAAEAYRLIDDAQTPVLVPYGERGRELIARLSSMPAAPDPQWLRAFDRSAQRYVVGVYERDLRALLANECPAGAPREVLPGKPLGLRRQSRPEVRHDRNRPGNAHTLNLFVPEVPCRWESSSTCRTAAQK